MGSEPGPQDSREPFGGGDNVSNSNAAAIRVLVKPADGASMCIVPSATPRNTRHAIMFV